MLFYAVISPDGAILRHGRCQEGEIAFQSKTDAVIEIEPSDYRDNLDAVFYFADNELTPKSQLVDGDSFTVAANGVDKVSFPLPAGTKLIFDGSIYDGEKEFVFSSTEVGEFIFDFFPPASHVTKRITINAV